MLSDRYQQSKTDEVLLYCGSSSPNQWRFTTTAREVAMTTERRRGTVTLRQVSGSARSKKVRVDLGDESSFTAFPAPVKVGDASYFLVRGRDGYKLLSTVCPHQGGEIEDEGDELFVCDGHGWQYEKAEGTCTNRPDFRMKAFLVTSQNDRLIALVPDE